MKPFHFISSAILLLQYSACALTISDGAFEWKFAEVRGTSLLPLEFMRTGENVTNLQSVTLPRYWIAEKLVTYDDFSSLMGRKTTLKDGKSPVREIEWDDARQFCERFTQKHKKQLPATCIVSMPSMIEWAHAVRVLDGKVDLCGEVGTFLFTGSAFGGYLHTLWKGADPLTDAENANLQLAWNLAVVPKRLKSTKVGLRLVIIDVSNEMLGDHPIVSRGMVSIQHGHFAEARQYLELAKERGHLSSNELERADKALAYANSTHENDQEDWSGLVAVSARCAEKDYVTEPYCSGWQMVGWEDSPDGKIASAYANAGIFGKLMRIGELPKEIQGDQMIGEEHYILLEKEDKKITFKISTNTLVQVVRCDFTGDGKSDMVVELFGAGGSLGYCYNFYQQLPGGMYTNVYELQTVGLCVLPSKNGHGCGFLTVDKCSNPVLATRLLVYDKGEITGRDANSKPFYMLDAREDYVYLSAPFIGAGYGLGWRFLEGRNIWYRPLFWPWEAGSVQRN